MTVDVRKGESSEPPAESTVTDIGAVMRGRLFRRQRAEQRARLLEARYGWLEAQALLAVMTREIFPGRVAVVSSFGTESAVLLDLVRRIDPGLPVVFIDSGRHFDETLAYAATLKAHFGLTNLRTVAPAPADLLESDPDGTLVRGDPDLCCHLRKTLPLERALAGFDAWVTGRKRFHGDRRSDLRAIEAVDGRIKINPLANWSRQRIAEHFLEHALPHHPLVARGYSSIGCAPCTDRPLSADDPRSGRWAATQKTECGIHKAPWARAAMHGLADTGSTQP